MDEDAMENADQGTAAQTIQHQHLLAEASRVLAATLDYPTGLTHLVRLLVPNLADWCVIENASDIITILDVDSTIHYTSPSVQRILGYVLASVLGKKVVTFVYPDDAVGVTTIFQETICVPDAMRSITCHLQHNDSSWRFFEALSKNLLDVPAVAGVVVHARDITERKQAEERLQHQQEILVQSEKLAAMGSLLVGVAHELNNPLSVVVVEAGLLREAAEDGPLVEHTRKIVQAAERCARIVHNFFALARQHPPERMQVNLNAIVEETVELLVYPIRIDNIEVHLQLAENLPPLWADLHQLQQVSTGRQCTGNWSGTSPNSCGALFFSPATRWVQKRESFSSRQASRVSPSPLRPRRPGVPCDRLCRHHEIDL